MSDLVIRPLVAGEAPLFHSLADPGLVGRAILGDPYRMVADGGDHRPEWTWVALRDGVVVARAAWWAGPDDEQPKVLDWFDFAPGEDDAAVRLLRTAPLYGEYDLLLPPGWREQPQLLAAARSRMDAVTGAGLKQLVERYRYTWTSGDPLPARTGRLEYRPVSEDAVILDVLLRIQEGTLDAHDREEIEKNGNEAAARSALDFLDWLPSPRAWWRLAYTPDGELAGLHIPARNPAGWIIGFIGVVPEQRGHGYAYDLLVECTRDLVELGADRIGAATDQGNVPMAAHFAKAGYPVSQERINFI